MRILLAAAALLATAACSAAPPETARESGAAATEGEGAGRARAPAVDPCSPEAGRARLEKTFDRTVDCAADAASAGLADKVKLAGDAVKDTKRIVDALRPLLARLRVTNLSSARAVLCVRTVTDYVTAETAKDAIKAAADGLPDGELDQLANDALSSFTFGVSEVFQKADAAAREGSLESLVQFLTAFGGAASNLGGFATTCAPVLAEYGAVSLPAIHTYAARLADLGVAAGILKCGFAVVGNAIDVGTELACFAEDLQRLREQEATLARMNEARCANFQVMTENVGLRPLLEATGDTSDARRTACYRVIHHWGSCVYDAEIRGLLWSRSPTCGECERLCTGYVNGAGPNAYLDEAITSSADRSGAVRGDVLRLVRAAALSCGSNVAPDGLRPCVNFCRGQVDDCP